MAYEMVVAMNVTDPEVYASYRREMRPILEKYGGGFRYDFEVSRTYTNESSHPVNRLFAIYFSDEEASTSFFSDAAYIEVKRRFYDSSVDGYTVIASYRR